MLLAAGVRCGGAQRKGDPLILKVSTSNVSNSALFKKVNVPGLWCSELSKSSCLSYPSGSPRTRVVSCTLRANSS